MTLAAHAKLFLSLSSLKYPTSFHHWRLNSSSDCSKDLPLPALIVVAFSIFTMANPFGGMGKFIGPIVLAYVAQQSIYDVKGGTRAVIFDRLSGVKDTVVNEGTHFLIPWLQRSIIYDVRTKPRNISTTTGSKDLQMVSLTLRVLHRPEVTKLPKIYQVSESLMFTF